MGGAGSLGSMKGGQTAQQQQGATTGMGMNTPGSGIMGLFGGGQPYAAGIPFGTYTQQQTGAYTGGPPQSQGYQGMGQGYFGNMGPMQQNSSMQNPYNPQLAGANRGMTPLGGGSAGFTFNPSATNPNQM